MRSRYVLFAILFAGLLAAPAAAKDAVLGVAHQVPTVSAHDGATINLHVWEKRARRFAPAEFAKPGRVVVLAHGATISGVPDFDLQLPPDKDGLAYSLMDYLAGEGYDVFTVDYQGYGGSDKTPCGRCVTTQVAADDIGATVAFIRKLRGVERVQLLGWSWGASTAGLYAQQHPEHVVRLVQYALNVAVVRKPELVPAGEFRPLDMEGCCRGDFVAEQTDAGVFDAYAAQSRKWEDRAPNGVRVDVLTRMPVLDPTRIAVPTLLVYGALDNSCPIDQAELPGYFRDLATRDKSFVIVPDAGHGLILERKRGRLYREAAAWFAMGR
jgi:pimeloyl-ACP methyl ester carboxylesterase